MQKVAIFDFNGTLLPHDFGPKFLQYHKEFFNEPRILRKAYFKIAMKIVKYKLISSYSKEQFSKEAFDDLTYTLKSYDRETIDSFFSYAGKEFARILDEEILRELEKVKSKGYYTVLLSGNYRELLEYMIKEIGIHFVIGSELSYKTVDSKEMLDFSVDMEIIQNEMKAIRFKEHFDDINFQSSVAYADSYYDMPILDLVGMPICVNPDDKLLEIANEKEYKVLYTKLKDIKMK